MIASAGFALIGSQISAPGALALGLLTAALDARQEFGRLRLHTGW
jgi:hypothetical protein